MNPGKIIRTLTGPAARFISLQQMISVTGQKLIQPFYHSVSDTQLPHLRHVLKIRNVATFKADLAFFLKYFRPVDAREVMQKTINQTRWERPSFHLSFDDGLKEMVTVVAPLLIQKGIPATFFINSGFIGNKDLFFRYKASLLIEKTESLHTEIRVRFNRILDNYGIEKGDPRHRLLSVDYPRKAVLDEIAPILEVSFRTYTDNREVYMNEKDIRELQQQGFIIGAHSVDHPSYKNLAPEEQIRQTYQSLQYLEKSFGVAPALFSFPFSDEGVSAEFFHRIYRPQGPADLTFGVSGLKKEGFPAHLHRIPMENGRSASGNIRGEYLYYMMKAALNKNIIKRK